MYEAAINCYSDTKSESKLSALNVLATLWELYPDVINVNEVLEFFMRGGKENSLVLRLGTVSILFKILDMLIEYKHHMAPNVYRTLSFILIENY